MRVSRQLRGFSVEKAALREFRNPHQRTGIQILRTLVLGRSLENEVSLQSVLVFIIATAI